jgi:hypothetical protein
MTGNCERFLDGGKQRRAGHGDHLA